MVRVDHGGAANSRDLGATAPSPGGKSRADSRRRVREAVSLELLAQRSLEDLAGRRMRNAFDESHIVGHPPFGDLAFHEFQDLLARRLLAGLELHDQKRSLVPFRMMDADHG